MIKLFSSSKCLTLGIIFLSWKFQILFSQDGYLERSEKQAKEVLGKTVQALGGEAFLKTQDVTTTGKFYQFRKDDLQGVGQFYSYDKFPFKSRTEFGKKKEIVTINNGDKGWKIEYKVVKEQSSEEIRNFQINMRHNLDYILRFRLDEEGMKFRYLGKSRIDLDEVEGVQLIDKGDDRIKIFVNASSFLPVKMEYRSPGFGKRWPSEDEEYFHNYHEIQGVQIPFGTVRYSNGYKSAEIQLESVKLNSGLPDSFFVASLKK
jgi:outer membrane lipoprotein-sorting protein